MLYELAEAEGVTIDELGLGNLESVIVETENGLHIGINADCAKIPQRQREILAHELGHCVRGALYRRGGPYPEGKYERQATAWSIEFLIPEELLKKRLNILGPDASLSDIAESFGVGVDFLQKAIEYYKLR